MSDQDSTEELESINEHWGEMPEKEKDYYEPDVSEDINKSMQRDCLDRYSDGESVMQIKDYVIPPMDPLVIYAIQLHKWMNNMTETIRLAEVATESNLIPPEDAKVPIPKMPGKMPMELTKEESDIPELSEPTVKKILTKCVAVMTSHIGFEDSFQSVLDVLVDVLEQFLLKICGRFVSAVEEQDSLGCGGFPNVLERVLMEMELGGVKGLHNYYQCRVIKYISVLQKRCQELEQHYSSLIVPRSDSPTGEIGKWFRVRVKKEEDSMETDSEIGYSDADLITSNSQLLSNLEPEVESMQYLTEGHDQIMYSS